MYTYTHVHIYIYTCIYIYVYVYVCVLYLHACIYVYIVSLIFTYMHLYNSYPIFESFFLPSFLPSVRPSFFPPFLPFFLPAFASSYIRPSPFLSSFRRSHRPFLSWHHSPPIIWDTVRLRLEYTCIYIHVFIHMFNVPSLSFLPLASFP